MSKKKDRSLRLIKSHCNVMTNKMIDKYNMLEHERPAKGIAKVNQVTDLLISISNNPWLINIIEDAVQETIKYINESSQDR